MPRRHVLTGLLAALVVASLAAALAASYWLLLGARLLTALAQALFWAVLGLVSLVEFLGEVGGFSRAAISPLLMAFGVACLAGAGLTAVLLCERWLPGARTARSVRAAKARTDT